MTSSEKFIVSAKKRGQHVHVTGYSGTVRNMTRATDKESRDGLAWLTTYPDGVYMIEYGISDSGEAIVEGISVDFSDPLGAEVRE